MTSSTLAVLAAFLDDPAGQLYGLQISRVAGVASGTLYPILDRLEEAGILVSGWEQVDASQVGRPRRRHYRLTPSGAALAAREVDAARLRLTPKWARPGLAT